MNRRVKVFAVLPTLLTLGNAVCGFGAITLAAKWSGYDPATSLLFSACLIYLAMVFDALDGSTARWANQTSEFGAQLDSLCDVVSFGVAPAFLMLNFSLPHGYPTRLLWLIGALYVVCAVLRLARFNVESDDEDSHAFFSGLPSPAAAGTVASFPIMVYGLERLDLTENDLLFKGIAEWFQPVAKGGLPFITFAVACLMVSRFKYVHTFNQLVRGRRTGRYLIKLVFAAAVIFVVPQVSVPLLFCWYAFFTPVKATWDRCVGGLFAPRKDPTAAATLPDARG